MVTKFRIKLPSHRKKKFKWGKNFQIDIFVLKYVLNNSESVGTKKFFSKNFQFFGKNFQFFGHQFFEKMAKSQKKNFNGKYFLKSMLSF